MFLSLAMLPVALVGAIITLGELWRGRADGSTPASTAPTVMSTAASVAWSLFGFAIPILLLFLWKTNLIAIWSWNLRNHEGFYDHNTRSYWWWFFVNPLELAFSLGWPVIVLAVAATLLHKPWRRIDSRTLVFAACFGVWCILWLSGKNMGEAARLWLFVMPWPIWYLAGLFDVLDGAGPAATPPQLADAPPRHGVWLAALLAQLAVCVATVTRVNGFDFGL
jgi:hypothetical protein